MKLAFVHNVHSRYQSLEYNVNLHSKYFPSADTYIMYNLKSYEDTALYLDPNIKSKYFSDTEHKLGCTNGFILGIKETLRKEYDVVIFAHDDVYINEPYIDVIQDKIKLIHSYPYNFIARRPVTSGHYNIYGKEYIMMESIYLNGNYVKESFPHLKPLLSEEEIKKDKKNSISPEAHLYSLLGKNGLIIDYEHKTEDYNKILGETLGFYHKNAGTRGWNDSRVHN
jgi:hypothetical protein